MPPGHRSAHEDERWETWRRGKMKKKKKLEHNLYKGEKKN